MKPILKAFILSISLFTIGTSSAFSQYNNDAHLVSKNGPVAVIRVSGMHQKKKEASLMAVKSAFNTYFYYGIAGLNDGKPLLTAEEENGAKNYMDRFFSDTNMRYMSFVAEYEEDKNPERLPNKMYKATVVVRVYEEALLRDMERSKVRSKTAAEKTVEDVKDEVYQPTIMVVPYKQGNLGYKEILRESGFVDLRAAIARVQNKFIKKGFEIKDVMAVLDATEKSSQFESNTSVESFDSQLINNSGADVYVTVDAGYNTNEAGSMGSVTLTAYERASGKVLASKHSTTNRYRKATFADLFRIAIQMVAEDFMSDVTHAYAKKADMGSTLVLRVSVGNDSATNLDTDVPSLSIPLSDALRLWMRKNALNGRFHVQGVTRELIIFDEVQIPNKAKEGYFLDANDFALDIFMYLRTNLSINCDRRVDGNTVYITINE